MMPPPVNGPGGANFPRSFFFQPRDESGVRMSAVDAEPPSVVHYAALWDFAACPSGHRGATFDALGGGNGAGLLVPIPRSADPGDLGEGLRGVLVALADDAGLYYVGRGAVAVPIETVSSVQCVASAVLEDGAGVASGGGVVEGFAVIIFGGQVELWRLLACGKAGRHARTVAHIGVRAGGCR